MIVLAFSSLEAPWLRCLGTTSQTLMKSNLARSSAVKLQILYYRGAGLANIEITFLSCSLSLTEPLALMSVLQHYVEELIFVFFPNSLQCYMATKRRTGLELQQYFLVLPINSSCVWRIFTTVPSVPKLLRNYFVFSF